MKVKPRYNPGKVTSRQAFALRKQYGFDESKIKRDKDGKFATKEGRGGGGSEKTDNEEFDEVESILQKMSLSELRDEWLVGAGPGADMPDEDIWDDKEALVDELMAMGLEAGDFFPDDYGISEDDVPRIADNLEKADLGGDSDQSVFEREKAKDAKGEPTIWSRFEDMMESAVENDSSDNWELVEQVEMPSFVTVTKEVNGKHHDFAIALDGGEEGNFSGSFSVNPSDNKGPFISVEFDGIKDAEDFGRLMRLVGKMKPAG